MRILHSSQINPTRISNFLFHLEKRNCSTLLFSSIVSPIKALSKQFIFSFSYYNFYHSNYASDQFIAFHHQFTLCSLICENGLGLLNIFCFPGDMMLSLVSRGHWRDSAGGNSFPLVLVLSGLSFIRFLEQIENCSLRAKSSLLPVFKWLAGTTK